MIDRVLRLSPVFRRLEEFEAELSTLKNRNLQDDPAFLRRRETSLCHIFTLHGSVHAAQAYKEAIGYGIDLLKKTLAFENVTHESSERLKTIDNLAEGGNYNAACRWVVGNIIRDIRGAEESGALLCMVKQDYQNRGLNAVEPDTLSVRVGAHAAMAEMTKKAGDFFGSLEYLRVVEHQP